MNEYTLADIHVGMEESFAVEITSEMEDTFRVLTGDYNPLHSDDDFANSLLRTDAGGGHVTFGMLTASLLSTLAGMYLPGKYSLIHSVEISFLKPVYMGNILNVKGIVSEISEGLRLIKLKTIITRLGEAVCKAKMKVLVLK